MYAKLGERPTILDSHSDKVLKDFTDQKRDEKMCKKSSDISVYNTINREENRRSRRWYTILYTVYSVPTTTSPILFPVDGVVHRNIGTFLYIFSSRFWSVKSFKTMYIRLEMRVKGQ